MTYGAIKLAVVVMVVLGAGAAGVKGILSRSEVRRRMREAPSQLADHSLVTLSGTVRLIGEPLIAPLSGCACVLHRSTARIYKGPAPLYGRIRPVDYELTEVELVRFTLVTRDGDVVVDGEIAEVPDRGTPIIPRQLDREQTFLEKHGDGNAARDCGFDEIVIEPGAKVSVHGIARVEIEPGAGGEGGFRDAPTVVRIVGDDRHPLTIMRG